MQFDFGRTMRRVEHHVRQGRVHRDAELVVRRLLSWKRKDLRWVEVTITALAKELHIGRAKVVETLRDLAELGVLAIERTKIRCACSGQVRQGTNRYRFLADPPEFPSGTARITRRIRAAIRVLATRWQGAREDEQ